MTDHAEQDDLDSGVTGAFWQRFTDHARQEWGPAGERYQQAVKKALEGKSETDAIAYLRMVVFAQSEIATLLRWPLERVSALKHATQRAVMEPGSRRGPGL